MRKIYIVLVLCFNLGFSQSSDVFTVARSGTVKELNDLMLKNPDVINSKNENGFTPLILACYKGNTEVAKFLVSKSNSVNEKTEMGTALMAATVKGDLELVKLLLEKKANPDLTDNNGTTALIFAVQFGYNPIIKILLEYNANKSKLDKNGKTAFEYATLAQNDEIINMLK